MCPTSEELEQQRLRDLFNEGEPMDEAEFAQVFTDPERAKRRGSGGRVDWLKLARSYGFASEKDMLHQWYIVEQKPLREIAEDLGTSHVSVKHKLELCQVPIRQRGGRGKRKQLKIKEFLNTCGYTLPQLRKKFKNLNRAAEALGVPYGTLYRLWKTMEEEGCEPVDSATDSPTE